MPTPMNPPLNSPIASLVRWLESQDSSDTEKALGLIGQYFREGGLMEPDPLEDCRKIG